MAVKSIYVPGPIPVSCSIQNTPISTPNFSDGEIFVTIFNGTPNYTIEFGWWGLSSHRVYDRKF